MSKRVTATLTMTLVVLLLAALVAACGGPQEEPTLSVSDGKALVEERCTKCHNLERVEQAKKTEEEWKANVERMVGKGAELNQAEQELVIRYLADAYPK